jgi:cytochrome c oxidase cbb3-type subunit 3
VRRAIVRFIAPVFVATVLAACQPGGESAGKGPGESPEQLRADSKAFDGRPVSELMFDAAAMQVARRQFMLDCASCHGADGRGSRGVIDLTAGRFNYGTDEEAIRTTIGQGRRSVMPPMRQSNLGEVDVGQLVSYVQSLSNPGGTSTDYQKRGMELFAKHCAACHGADGRGSADKGAPDLTDDYWQHGNSMMNVRLVISGGEQSESPAFAGKLSSAQIDLLTAYVQKLMRAPGPGS